MYRAAMPAVGLRRRDHAQPIGSVERPVRRSSTSERGSETHRDIDRRLMSFGRARHILRAEEGAGGIGGGAAVERDRGEMSGSSKFPAGVIDYGDRVSDCRCLLREAFNL